MSAEHFLNQAIDGEEYRTRTEISSLPPHLAAEFVSYRDFAARDLGWGYVNTLWIHRVRSARPADGTRESREAPLEPGT